MTQSASQQRNQVPPEILLIIFQHALPSSTTLEKSVINAPKSTWSEEYEVKCTMVAVCKLWWDVGLGLLYNEVVIRQVDSLPALLCTIISPNTDIGELIKKIAILCTVPFSDDIMAFKQHIKHIIVHCPSLSQLTIHLSFLLISIDTELHKVQLQPLCISDDILNITHLDWEYFFLLSDLISLLLQS